MVPQVPQAPITGPWSIKTSSQGSTTHFLAFLTLSALVSNTLPTLLEPPSGMLCLFYPRTYLPGSIQWLSIAYKIKSKLPSPPSRSARPEAIPPTTNSLTHLPRCSLQKRSFCTCTTTCRSLGRSGPCSQCKLLHYTVIPCDYENEAPWLSETPFHATYKHFLHPTRMCDSPGLYKEGICCPFGLYRENEEKRKERRGPGPKPANTEGQTGSNPECSQSPRGLGKRTRKGTGLTSALGWLSAALGLCPTAPRQPLALRSADMFCRKPPFSQRDWVGGPLPAPGRPPPL